MKTATDQQAARINLVPKRTTIAELAAKTSENPGTNHDLPRQPDELQTYTVTANLDAVKQEADSDFHLALSDNGATMIAEIPNAPACTEPPVAPEVSVLEPQIEQARTDFIREFGQPSSGGFTPINHRITVTGVLYYDFNHGQRDVAPNAAELHPVTAVADP